MHSMKNLFIITVQTSRNSEIIKIHFFPNIPQFAYPPFVGIWKCWDYDGNMESGAPLRRGRNRTRIEEYK